MQRHAQIDPALSLFLDILRFTAALMVLFGHITGKWLTGGHLWQLGGLHHAAVMIFFVLSGYVVAATTRQNVGPLGYTAARVSRLYSVILPALALTWVFDTLGHSIDPAFYEVTVPAESGGNNITDNAYLRYALSALMIQEWWVFPMPVPTPGTNAPFWSLTYEATYYVAFGILVFTRGTRRVLCLAALFLFAGPRILLLWPLWLLGAGAWLAKSHVPANWALPLLVSAVAMTFCYVLFKPNFDDWEKLAPPLVGDRLILYYAVGLATTALILGLSLISTSLPVNRWVSKCVRRVADHTFELYLLHIPVGLFVVAISPLHVTSWAHVAMVYASIGIVVITTARVTAPLKTAIRRGISLQA